MARARDARILLLDRAGQLVRVSGGTLGPGGAIDVQALLPDGFEHTRPMLSERATGTGRYAAASVLAVDVGGGRSATLVVIEDVSRTAETRQFTNLAWLLGVGLLGLLPLLLLWFYLRRAFEPLDEAVDALASSPPAAPTIMPS
jgi:hypothetical protein